MGFFDFISKPNIEKCVRENDIQGLIKALQFPDLINDAAIALGKKKSTDAVEPLIQILDNESTNSSSRSGVTKSIVITALREIGDPRAVEPLIQCLLIGSCDHEEVRQAVCAIDKKGLEKEGSKYHSILKREMEGSDSDSWIPTIEAIGLLRYQNAVETVVSVLHYTYGRGGNEVKFAALDALARIENSQAVKGLLEASTSYDNEIKARATQLYRSLRSPEAIETIVQNLYPDSIDSTGRSVDLLKNEYYVVRLYAVNKLYQIGTDDAITGLCSALQDKNQEVKLHTVQVLEKLNSPISIEPLILAALHAKRKRDNNTYNAINSALNTMKIPPSFKNLFLLHLIRIEEEMSWWNKFLTKNIPMEVISSLSERVEIKMEETKSFGTECQEFFHSGDILFDIYTIPTSISEAANWFKIKHGGYLNCLESGLDSPVFQNRNSSVYCTIIYGWEKKQGYWVHLGVFPAKDNAPTQNMLWPVELMSSQERDLIKSKTLRTGQQKKDLSSRSPTEWNDFGLDLYEHGRYQEAIDAYDKAIQLDPNYKWPWNNKGVALKDLGKNREAIDAYNKAIEIDPNFTEVWNNKGFSLNQLGEYEKGLEACKKAIQIDPYNKYAWCNMGNALVNLGKHHEGIDAYNKAIEIDPNYIDALKNKQTVSKWHK
jgi:tetratricopeptide (TPR) repeat protein